MPTIEVIFSRKRTKYPTIKQFEKQMKKIRGEKYMDFDFPSRGEKSLIMTACFCRSQPELLTLKKLEVKPLTEKEKELIARFKRK